MWIAKDNALVYEAWENILVSPLFSPEWTQFSGEIIRIPTREISYNGFDDWLSHFPREEEIKLVEKTILSISNSPRRVHIDGISCAESVELIREYYRSCWYEDALAKNYILPPDEFLTVSVSLPHILWCEKDKEFLHKKLLCELTPPLRSPHDLRALQQATRMGIIMGIECNESFEIFLTLLLEKQILSAYQLASLLSFRWIQHGFRWNMKDVSIALPTFPVLGDITVW